jgi:hypothetical protein
MLITVFILNVNSGIISRGFVEYNWVTNRYAVSSSVRTNFCDVS